MEQLALIFINSTTIWVAFFGIIIIAIYQYWAFATKINPLIIEFDHVNEKLAKSKPTKEDFCVYYEEEFNELMSNTDYLSDSWREFNETLLIPEVDFDVKSDESWKILNTHHTSVYFNQRYILWSKVNMRWYNALPNILTGIGIMGTFIGLVAGIYIASPGLSADNIDEAKEALNTLLSGASMAFLTSIAGLASSMLFSRAEKAKIHEFDKLCQEFVAEIDERVEYFSQERLSNKVLQETIKQSNALETFANDLAVTMGKVLEEKVSMPLVGAINDLTEKQKSANDETIEKVMKEFAESIAGAAGEEMKSLASTIEAMSNKLEEQIKALSEGHKAMNETATQIIEKMTFVADEASSNIQNLSVELEGAVNKQVVLNESNSELHERVKETIFSAGNIVEQVKDSLEGIDDTVAKQNSLIDLSNQIANRFENTSLKIEKTHEHIVSVQEQLNISWQEHQERFGQVDEALSNMFNNLNDGLTQYANSTNEYLIGLDKHAAKVVNELALASKEISASVEGIGDGLDQHGRKFLATVTKATNTVNAL